MTDHSDAAERKRERDREYQNRKRAQENGDTLVIDDCPDAPPQHMEAARMSYMSGSPMTLILERFKISLKQQQELRDFRRLVKGR